MGRTAFYTEEKVDGIMEFDFLKNSLSNFVMKYDHGEYRVGDDDIMRPELISFKVYGSVQYWWLICHVNKIYDIFNDIKSGMLLIIPNMIDIYDFTKQYKVK